MLIDWVSRGVGIGKEQVTSGGRKTATTRCQTLMNYAVEMSSETGESPCYVVDSSGKNKAGCSDTKPLLHHQFDLGSI